MRTRHLLTAALALAVLASLTGCGTPAKLHEKHHPTPSPTPVFSSDEEALAAAEAAYARYTSLSDSIASDGGKDPQRLAPVVTAEWLQREVEAFDQLAKSGKRQIGTTKFGDVELQQFSDDGSGRATLVAYVCVDVSGTRFIDSSGADVTPPTRPKVFSVVATFEASSSAVVLSNNEPWDGEPFC